MSNLPFVEEILADLRRFKECVEDNQDVDLDRDRFALLTRLGLLERVQRSPARWMMTQAGEDAIAQPAAGEPVARELLRQAFRLISTTVPEGVAAGLDDPSKQAWWYRECNPTAVAISEYLGKSPATPAAAPVAVGEPAKYWAFHNEFGELRIEDRWDVAKHLPFDLIPLITPPAAAHGDKAVTNLVPGLQWAIDYCKAMQHQGNDRMLVEVIRKRLESVRDNQPTAMRAQGDGEAL